MRPDLIDRGFFICPWQIRVASILKHACMQNYALSYDVELFIILTKEFSGAKRVNIKMKAIEQYSHIVLFCSLILLHKQIWVFFQFCVGTKSLLIRESVKAGLTPVERNSYCRKREICTLLLP